MAKLQFNPSTLKVLFNPTTDKVQFAVAPPDECDNCKGRLPETASVVISGVADCDCIDSAYKVNPGLAATVNGSHVLQLQSGAPSTCQYKKSVVISSVLEYWPYQLSPWDPCHSYDCDCCTFTELIFRLQLWTYGTPNVFIVLSVSTIKYPCGVYPYHLFCFDGNLQIGPYLTTYCKDCDGIIYNDNTYECVECGGGTGCYVGALKVCKDGIAIVTL